MPINKNTGIGFKSRFYPPESMEIAMKSPWKIIVVPFVALALLATVETAYAQDTAASSVPITKKMMRKEDRALAASVRKHLDKQHVATADITILARAGAVYLVGTVTDPSQIPVAGDAAAQVDGVKSVKNNLTVRVAGH
jgi:hyperosmotically inducible protein